MNNKARVDVIRQIQEVGYLSEIDTAQLSNTPKLIVNSNPEQSVAFKLGWVTALYLDLHITANRPIRIMEFGNLKIGGHELNMNWWVHEGPVYRFYGKVGPEFPWNVVLNHRVGDKGLVRPGIPMDGFLLGRCSTSLALSDLQGFCLPATLSILDGENVHFAEVSFRFDQSLDIKIARPRSSLFGTSTESSNRPPEEDRSSPAAEVVPKGRQAKSSGT